MDIPLKGEIPRLTKAYKLSDIEKEALNDIPNFLIFFGLAENVDSNSNYWSPVFLVERQSSNWPPRLVFDVRKKNEISNAFFSIKLSEKNIKNTH